MGRPQTHWDWLAVAGLWIGAVIEAIKAPNLPLPVGAPILLTSEVWNFFPLILISFSAAIWIREWMGYRGGAHSDGAPFAGQAHGQLGSAMSLLNAVQDSQDFLSNRVTKYKVVPKSERRYVPDSFSARLIEKIIEGATRAQIGKILRPHEGQWLVMSGSLYNCSPGRDYSLATISFDGSLSHSITVKFASDYNDHIADVDFGEAVIFEGEIINNDGVMEIAKCELH